MQPPRIEHSGTQVRISWIAPYDNGATITQYLIEIKQNPSEGSSYFQELVNCDGSKVDVYSLLSCDIPMDSLRAVPFHLQYNQLIQARVSALNIIGWNVPSDPNIVGALIRTEPV